ncbi:hypothetical protein ABXJ76_18520 [Methylobacter sp. G7]
MALKLRSSVDNGKYEKVGSSGYYSMTAEMTHMPVRRVERSEAQQ